MSKETGIKDIRFTGDIESWWRLCCHFCGSINWVLENGDLALIDQDFTMGIKCWKCGENFWYDLGSANLDQVKNIYQTMGQPNELMIQIIEGLPRPRQSRESKLK